MKFYLVTNNVGEVEGCELSFSSAKKIRPDEGCITQLEIKVCAETIRRLLSETGGYASAIKTYESKSGESK